MCRRQLASEVISPLETVLEVWFATLVRDGERRVGEGHEAQVERMESREGRGSRGREVRRANDAGGRVAEDAEAGAGGPAFGRGLASGSGSGSGDGGARREVVRVDVEGDPVEARRDRGDEVALARHGAEEERPGQHKGAKFSTFKAHISATFDWFQLIFGRVIISLQVPER